MLEKIISSYFACAATYIGWSHASYENSSAQMTSFFPTSTSWIIDLGSTTHMKSMLSNVILQPNIPFVEDAVNNSKWK